MSVNAIQIVGYKKTGKTTLVCRLTAYYAALGYRVGTIKHDGHDFEPDVPGTDSWRHRRAGASATAVVSATRTAWFEERTTPLDELFARMDGVDLAIVEGWKREKHPKLALVQSPDDLSLLRELEGVAAAASWHAPLREEIGRMSTVPAFDFDDTAGIAEFLLGCM